MDKSIEGDFHITFKEDFEQFALGLTKTFKDFHDMLFKWAKDHKIPMYIFRFEDYLTDKEPVLNEIFSFLL